MSALTPRRRPGLRAMLAALSVSAVMALSGCATQHPHDPLESWNRGVFSFNETVDTHVLKPVAETYVDITPDPVRTGVRNFFGNINDVWSSANLFLQGRFKDGAASTMRVAVNSTLGLGGLIDIATPMRLERFNEDLGQTLGVYGMPPGAYIVWPLLGPSTLRDSVNIAGDVYFSATTLTPTAREDNLLRLLSAVNTRASFLSAKEIVDEVALDRYTFIRDAYLQRRQSLIYEGNPPEETEAPQPRYDLPESDDGEAPVPAPAASAASAASAP